MGKYEKMWNALKELITSSFNTSSTHLSEWGRGYHDGMQMTLDDIKFVEELYNGNK